jgi:hypothetical protein
MTMTEQIQKKKRKTKPIKVSERMQEALDALSLDFDKLQPRVDKVFTIGREDGMKDKVIGKVIRAKMKEHYSKSTFYNVIEKYPEARISYPKKIPKNGIFPDASICPKCGKPYKDPEGEVWQFNVEEFRIQSVPKAPRQYLEMATEHFYAETRKWKKKYEEVLAKSKPKPKKVQGTAADKAKLLDDAMQFREKLIGQERRRSSDE